MPTVKMSRADRNPWLAKMCFERSAKICEPLDIEAKKPRICGRQIMRDSVEAESRRLLFSTVRQKK